MWIEVKIPYEPKRKLAFAYNRAMISSVTQWVLLLDQDVFLCNPLWYKMCLDAIKQLKGTKAGLVACVTSGPRQKSLQKASSIESDNIEDHISIAQQVYQEHRNELIQVHIPVTGFFMLIKRQAWKKVKFQAMNRGVGGVDIDFSKRLLEAGYSIWLMKGLYVYHRRGLRKLRFNEGKI